MPNYIKNKVELVGSMEEVQSLVQKFSTHYEEKPSYTYDGRQIYKNELGEYGWLDENTKMFTRRNKDSVLGIPDGFKLETDAAWTRFPDFEKIFPVPNVIKAVGDSVNESIINAVKAKYYADVSSNALLAALQLTNRQNVNLRTEDHVQYDLACKAYEETGFAYWYDYNNAKWGTKWNAFGCEKINETKYIFETAWSGVPDLIKELSKSFKGVIRYKFADEDTGYNTGDYKIKSGVILSEYRPVGGSKESYDLAFELRPSYKEDYILVNDNYVYKEDE